jgi:hypothetical protein
VWDNGGVDREELEYLREGMRRSDQRFAQQIARWDKRWERTHREIMARFERLDAKSDELLAEGREQRQALLAILDRLDGGNASAT